MIDIVTKVNKMVLEGAPLRDVIDACSVIDIEACFDPIFEPPLDFWKNVVNGRRQHSLRSVPPSSARSGTPGISLKLNALEMSLLPIR